MLVHLSLGPSISHSSADCEDVACTSYSVVRFKCDGNVLPAVLYCVANRRKQMIELIMHRRKRVECGCDIGMFLRVTSIPQQRIDFSWEARILKFFMRTMELERMLWNLSTLGGAYSAMGDFDQKYAETAAVISTRQLKIAAEIGDPSLVARCYLYMALSNAQRGGCKEALYVVSVIYKWAHLVKNQLLIRCCQGIHMKIRAIEKQYQLKVKICPEFGMCD